MGPLARAGALIIGTGTALLCVASGAQRRIVFIGDSITHGVGASSPEARYSSQLVRLLTRDGQAAVEVNLGRSGQALCQQGRGHLTEILDAEPDMVVVQWGLNDHYWGYSLAQFALAYEALVAGLREADPDLPIVLTTLIMDFRYPDTSERWIGPANVAIQEIAARRKCHVAYLHKALDHNQEEFCDDVVHPNDAGALAMAEAITEAILSPPLSNENARVRFDGPGETRFLQYVFLPEGDDGPAWVEVSDIRREGMALETAVPVRIRTAPIYAEGAYGVTVTDAQGETVSAVDIEITWERALQFRVDPGDSPQPLRVHVEPKGRQPAR